MPGGSQTQTQANSSEPWKPAQPFLEQGIKDANTLYQGGVGAQPYTGSTVIPFAQQTTQGMGSLQNLASANMGGQGISGQSQQIINSGGFNAPQQASMEYFSGAGTNPFDLSQNGAYQSYKSNALGDIQDRVNLSAGAAGRYGSGMHTGALTKSLSDASTQMDLAQMGRMDALNQGRFAAGQTGMGNLGSAYQLGQMPAGTMMDIGGMYEDLAGRVKNDELRIFNETQNKPWENLARANAIFSGAGSLGGSSTQTAQVPGQNPFLTAAGYGLGGLGLLGGII